ncbi:hypothetical protein GF324_05495 [bacterium]|nr:hypothetical protein [bacterium]
MDVFELQSLRARIVAGIEPLTDESYAERMKIAVPGETPMLGVKVPKLRALAKELAEEIHLTPQQWVQYISTVLVDGSREEVLVGAFILGKQTRELDDFFGERASQWGRELNNWELTDQLSVPIGWWVLEDLSRVGYLEAWAGRGETVWKQRLGIVTTVQLNHHGHSHPAETFRVLRRRMETDDRMLIKALGWAIREVKDQEAVERFLAWWAPRVHKTLLTEATKKLPPESRDRVMALTAG